MQKVMGPVLLSLLLCTAADSAVYKGQQIFQNTCKPCHADLRKLVTDYAQSRWQELMQNGGVEMAALHLKHADAKSSWAYFKGEQYANDSRHLKDFLMEYASDSGNVPVCD